MFRGDTNFSNKYDHSTWMIQVLKPLFLGKITVIDILFLTYSSERAHLEVQKTAEIISNILEYS